MGNCFEKVLLSLWSWSEWEHYTQNNSDNVVIIGKIMLSFKTFVKIMVHAEQFKYAIDANNITVT